MTKKAVEKQIEVAAIGSGIILGGDISATVLGVAIYGDGVQYLVSWWSGNSRMESWVRSCEITMPPKATAKIGFTSSHLARYATMRRS